jgi:hypothetical protein
MKIILIWLCVLLFVARTPAAEVDRFLLSQGDAVVLSEKIDQSGKSYALALAQINGTMTVFWEHKAGADEVPVELGGISGADRKGNDIAVAVFVGGDTTMFIVQANLATKDVVFDSIDVRILLFTLAHLGPPDAFKVIAPNTYEFSTNAKVGEIQRLQRQLDGHFLLDGHAYKFLPQSLNASSGMPPIRLSSEDQTANLRAKSPSTSSTILSSALTPSASVALQPVTSAPSVSAAALKWLLLAVLALAALALGRRFLRHR